MHRKPSYTTGGRAGVNETQRRIVSEAIVCPVGHCFRRQCFGERGRLNEFRLARHCLSGDATLMRFLQTSYEAAVDTGGWN